jgi:DNA-3-methyladenine glycosylase I
MGMDGIIDGIVAGDDGVRRCAWAGGDPLYRRYHDEEWGRPVKDDTRLYEKLCLEGFQSGLSWLTILRKRDNFRAAFRGFDIPTVAAFTDADIERLVGDAGIVRHRGKIVSTVNNARRALELQQEAGSLAAFVWRYEPDPASRPASFTRADVVPKTAESTALSKALLKRGWSFVGPTTVYAFMQAMGLVNDHFTGCDIRDVVERERTAFVRPK